MRACQVVPARGRCVRAPAARCRGGARGACRVSACAPLGVVVHTCHTRCVQSLVYILHMFNGMLKHSTFICVCGSWHAVGTAVEKAPQTTDSDQQITAKLLG